MKRAIAKMFPSLEDALETQWEQIRLGSGDGRTPGPTDYQYQGYIILSDEAAEKHARKKERFLNGDALFKLCNILG